MFDIIYKLFYKSYKIRARISDELYEVEYHRTPFWTYERRNFKTFFKHKLKSWHGQVWCVFKNGSRCGFGTTMCYTMFPKKHMKNFLEMEANRLYDITHE